MPIIAGGKVSEGVTVRPYRNAGAPVNGASGTLSGVAQLGDLLVDTTNAKLYICTNATPGAGFAWTVVGAQT